MKVERRSTVTEQKQVFLQQQQQLLNRKSSVWTKDKINQLIEKYKKHECLWNHWHESYKNKDKRNRAIEDICKTLHVPKFEFGKKIHNLRNQFNTEMKKLEQRLEESGVNIDDAAALELRCKWSHFESLMFLRHVIEPRPGGYQNAFQPPKKMRLKFDYNDSDDDINVTTVLPISSGSSNTANPEDLSQFQFEDNVNEEVINDDFQSLENEILEVEQQNCREEVCDQKYKPPQRMNNKNSQHLPQSSSTSSQSTIINNNDDSCAVELSSKNVNVALEHSQTISTASSTTPSKTLPLISSISSSSNTPITILRDQWDAFGELVANEFRNLNSDISRKRLKRKIMLAMLEVGEEDDHMAVSRSRTS